MTKRLHRSSSSSSSSDISSLNIDDDDPSISADRIPCRTKVTGRYQSDIYTGLISANRTDTNGRAMNRFEQLISIHHDDQIRSLLLVIRHYSMKHQWQRILFYLKSLLQSSFCRAYLRLYWQMIFRYLLEHFRHQSQLDLYLLAQVFQNLFHSPTIHRTQTFYSYLCLHLFHPEMRSSYIDMETRYKNLPRPFFSARCLQTPYLTEFDPKFEQLMLINLHFLYDYRQWLESYALRPTTINPFVRTVKISLEDERDLELWTFKLTTNFHEIQFISKDYFDNYDLYLLKYLHFLDLTETNVEQIPVILTTYLQQHPAYLNAYKYHYWYHRDRLILRKLIELDPSVSPYVLIYCRSISDPIEIFDRLFDYLDYEKNKHDYETWHFFAQSLLNIDIDDDRLLQSLQQNWSIRKSIWKKFHFQSFEKVSSDKVLVGYIFIECPSTRRILRENFMDEININRADELHERLMTMTMMINE